MSFKLENLEENLTVYSDSRDTQIGLNWTSEELVNVSVFDLGGQRIFFDKVTLRNGKNSIDLGIIHKLMPNQIYVITISGTNKNIASKFLTNQ